MNTIPTAEEFLENELGEDLSLRGCSADLAKDFKDVNFRPKSTNGKIKILKLL